MPVSGISEQGRATQGVKLINLDEGDEIAAITQLDDQPAALSNENGADEGPVNGNATETDENPSSGDITE
jgi:DNA gyrase subunit A